MSEPLGSRASERKVTTHSLRRMKERGEPITALTAYDHLMAALLAYLCNDANRLAFHTSWGSMPSRTSLRAAMSQFATEQVFKMASALSASSYSVPRTPGYFDYFNAMNPAVKDIALGADPAKVLPETAAKIDRLLAKYR